MRGVTQILSKYKGNSYIISNSFSHKIIAYTLFVHLQSTLSFIQSSLSQISISVFPSQPLSFLNAPLSSPTATSFSIISNVAATEKNTTLCELIPTEKSNGRGYNAYERCVRRLYLTNMFHPVKLGLDNINALHRALGNPMDSVSSSCLSNGGGKDDSFFCAIVNYYSSNKICDYYFMLILNVNE